MVIHNAVLATLVVLASPVVAVAQTGIVAGRVSNATTGTPLTGGSVRFCTTPNACTTASVSTSGVYSVTLPAGSYFVRTRSFDSQGFVNEIFPDIPCPGTCAADVLAMTGIATVVTAGTTTARDFALAFGGSISGVVTDALSGAPLAGVLVGVSAHLGGRLMAVASTTSNSAGAYSVGALSTGRYYAHTLDTQGFVDEIYDGVTCLTECRAVDRGTPIAVVTGAVTPGRHFSLTPAGRITGTVTDAGTLAAIPQGLVVAAMRQGDSLVEIASAFVGPTGTYTLTGLAPGTYFLVSQVPGYVNEYFDAVVCIGGCSLEGLGRSTPVIVRAGSTTSQRDFGLARGSSVKGIVRDRATGLPLGGARVSVLVQTGSASVVEVQSDQTAQSGAFAIPGLAPGTYFISVRKSGYATGLSGGKSCVLCSDAEILASTPIAVTAGATATGRDVSLDPEGVISGAVVEDGTNAPVRDATVTVFTDTPVAQSVVRMTAADNGNFQVPALAPGTYYLSADSSQHRPETFNDVPCPTTRFCEPRFVVSNGTPIAVRAGVAVPGIRMQLARRLTPHAPDLTAVSVVAGVLSMAWLPSTSGPAATSFRLEAGVAPGQTAVAFPATGTALTLPGVPAGTFFVRLRAITAAGLGDASDEVVLRVDSAGNMQPAAPVDLDVATIGDALSLTWTDPLGPTPSGYLVEALATTGGAPIAAIPTVDRHFVFSGVPPGAYFLRVRARFATQVSSPSDEVAINIGDVPAAPGPPDRLKVTVTGSTVVFDWQAPAIGAATSYVLEAGSATGLTNLASFDTGNAATRLVVPGVPPGRYFVRLRARSAQGLGRAGFESEFTVVGQTDPAR